MCSSDLKMKSVGIFVGVLCVLCGAASYAQGSGQFARFLSPRDAAITTVDDPTGLAPSSFVQRFELRAEDCATSPPYDDCKEGIERAELAEVPPNSAVPSSAKWYRWQVYFPEEFKSTYPAKNRFGQFIDHRAKEAPWVIEVGSTGVLWLGRRLNGQEEYFSLVDARELRGRWLDIIVEVVWDQKSGRFNLWVDNDKRAGFSGPTCSKCTMFFSYGLARVEIDRFKKRFPSEPLPTQVVYYTPVHYSATDPGWIEIPAEPEAKEAVIEPGTSESELPQEKASVTNQDSSEGAADLNSQDEAKAASESSEVSIGTPETGQAESPSETIIIIEESPSAPSGTEETPKEKSVEEGGGAISTENQPTPEQSIKPQNFPDPNDKDL